MFQQPIVVEEESKAHHDLVSIYNKHMKSGFDFDILEEGDNNPTIQPNQKPNINIGIGFGGQKRPATSRQHEAIQLETVSQEDRPQLNLFNEDKKAKKQQQPGDQEMGDDQLSIDKEEYQSALTLRKGGPAVNDSFTGFSQE